MYGRDFVFLVVFIFYDAVVYQAEDYQTVPILREMPYELAKGNLQWNPEESKERFFGKFVWGISMLRDELVASKNRALKLEKEKKKKMLLLSISHDIKIPLSAIRLYAKALRNGIYVTDAEKNHGAAQIERHAQEIETFVCEICIDFHEEDYCQVISVLTRAYPSVQMKCRICLTAFTEEAMPDTGTGTGLDCISAGISCGRWAEICLPGDRMTGCGSAWYSWNEFVSCFSKCIFTVCSSVVMT